MAVAIEHRLSTGNDLNVSGCLRDGGDNKDWIMSDGISEAILRFRTDAGGLVFTGFITNVRVPSPPGLEGEVWRHIHAEPSGTFADGHRIQTSPIVYIHTCGDSIWVETNNGNRYGLLSFLPQGWKYFSALHRANYQIDPVADEAPVFDLHALKHGSKLVSTGPLGKIIERRLTRESAKFERKLGGAKPLRPYSTIDYLERVKQDAHESIEALKSQGVNIIKHDN